MNEMLERCSCRASMEIGSKMRTFPKNLSENNFEESSKKNLKNYSWIFLSVSKLFPQDGVHL